MESLLEKFRYINKLLQKTAGNPVDFDEMATVLSSAVNANCYIVGRKGKIHGHKFLEHFYCGNVEALVDRQARFPEAFNNFLLSMTRTQANMEINNAVCMVNGQTPCKYGEMNLTITPVLCGGERLGTLFVSKREGKFDDMI